MSCLYGVCMVLCVVIRIHNLVCIMSVSEWTLVAPLRWLYNWMTGNLRRSEYTVCWNRPLPWLLILYKVNKMAATFWAFKQGVDTYRGGTGRRKQFGRLRFRVPTAHAWQVRHAPVANGMHASGNLPSMRTKEVGTQDHLCMHLLCDLSEDGIQVFLWKKHEKMH